MNTDDYEILVNATPGGTRPPDFAVKLLEDTCTRTGLDWKGRHLYLMQRGGKWNVTLSIDGFRLIGAQDPEYAGQEGPFWVTSATGEWTDIPPDGPIYASKVGIKHRNGTTTWGVAKFKDYAAGPMWTKFPSTMIAKCAEMLAWRKAMPGKLGGLYGTEEMAQADKPRAPSPAPEAAPVVAVGAADYEDKLRRAEGRLELKALGMAISKDKTLKADQVTALHALYTARMATV